MNTSISSGISHAEISVRARDLWYARGCPTGLDDEIWLEAEHQLQLERVKRGTPPQRSSSAKGVDIDDEALNERLDDFGDPGSRSVTSVDRPT